MFQMRGCGGIGGTCDKPSAKSIWPAGPRGTAAPVAPGDPPITFDYTIPAGATGVSVPLNGAAIEFPDGEHQGLTGVHITANQEGAAYGLGKQQDASEAFTVLPTDVLATKYTLMSWGPGNGGGEFAVIGTQPNTTVTITPRVPICNAGPCAANSPSHPVGVPYTVTLGMGELYQAPALLQAGQPQLDPTGTTISSDKPVAVMAGHGCAVVPSEAFLACNWLAEQLPPDQFWGKSYLTVPLNTQLGTGPSGAFVTRQPDTYKLLASEDGTVVRVNGTIVANLNGGDQYDARAGSAQEIPANAQITANRPVLVGEFSNGRNYDKAALGCNDSFATECNDDPFFALVPPTEHYLTTYTVPTFSMQFWTNLINLIVPTSAISAMKIDGTPVPPADFTAIGASGFSSAKEGVSNANFHTITGDGAAKFGAISYGFFGADAYGFPAGQGLVTPTSPPAISKVALAPKSETTSGLSSKCVTATVTDSNQAPTPDVRVDFTRTGANGGTAGVITNASGQAKHCYTPAAFGTDTITGAVGAHSDAATKTWTDPTNKPPPDPGGGGGGGGSGAGGSTGTVTVGGGSGAGSGAGTAPLVTTTPSTKPGGKPTPAPATSAASAVTTAVA